MIAIDSDGIGINYISTGRDLTASGNRMRDGFRGNFGPSNEAARDMPAW